MPARPAVLPALLAGALALGPVTASAQQAPAPAPAAAPARSPAAAGRGVIVVAVGDDAARAARALARAVYADPALRPAVDEATARALTGDAPEPGSEAKAAEIASVRDAAARAEAEAASRRLLASLGAEAGAALVAAVRIEGGRPVARVIRVPSAAPAPIELGATVHEDAPASRRFSWPGATDALRALLPPAPKPSPSGVAPRRSAASAAPSTATAPVAPSTSPDALADRSRAFWRSPWFWGALGAAAAVGGAVFAISSANDGEGSTLLVRGRIAP